MNEDDCASPGETVRFELSAKSCIWFAWADPLADGPQGEIPVGAYRPAMIPIKDAQEILVWVEDNAGVWAHHPGNYSGPEGLGPNFPLEVADYQDNPIYNSQSIEATAHPLNSLIGMLGPLAPPAVQLDEKGNIERRYKPEYIGRGPKCFDVGLNEVLFLGFHDGRHWENNVGEVTVHYRVPHGVSSFRALHPNVNWVPAPDED